MVTVTEFASHDSIHGLFQGNLKVTVTEFTSYDSIHGLF